MSLLRLPLTCSGGRGRAYLISHSFAEDRRTKPNLFVAIFGPSSRVRSANQHNPLAKHSPGAWSMQRLPSFVQGAGCRRLPYFSQQTAGRLPELAAFVHSAYCWRNTIEAPACKALRQQRAMYGLNRPPSTAGSTAVRTKVILQIATWG